MKKALLFIITACLVCNASAQKYKKIFYKAQTVENADVKVSITDAVATATGIKFKIKVKNKSNDYIIYKPSESAFKIGGKASSPVEKWMVLRPNEDDYKVIDLKGSQHMVAADYQFILDGLYKVIPSQGLAMPDFKLPPSQNDIKAGGFTVTLGKFKKETARTDAKFTAVYTGDKIGFFEPNKVAMKMPDGKEFANYHSDRKTLIFAKNETDDFAVAWKDINSESGDMQKVDMIIMWRDAFKEVTPEKLPSLILTVLFDEEMSNAKGR